MKNSFLIGILLIFQTNFGFAQVQNTNQIIDSSKNKLEKLVGEEIFKFFTLEKESYYQIKKRNGKTKWKLLKANRKIKDDFQQAQIQFYFKHFDFNYSTLKTTYIKLDSNLNLTNNPYFQYIPEFIMNKDSKKWISEKDIDEIIKNLEFKNSTYKKNKQLVFDAIDNTYHWEITNTLFEEPKHSKVEIYKLSPIDGRVLSREYEDQYTN